MISRLRDNSEYSYVISKNCNRIESYGLLLSGICLNKCDERSQSTTLYTANVSKLTEIYFVDLRNMFLNKRK